MTIIQDSAQSTADSRPVTCFLIPEDVLISEDIPSHLYSIFNYRLIDEHINLIKHEGHTASSTEAQSVSCSHGPAGLFD